MKIDYAKYGFYPVGPTPNDRQREWFERERMVRKCFMEDGSMLSKVRELLLVQWSLYWL